MVNMLKSNVTNYLNYINDYFDKIFVITLKRNTERHKFIKKYLYGINYTIFYGVDGKSMDSSFQDNIYNEVKAKQLVGRSLYPGEIGCALSHRTIYEEMIKNKYDKVLILEDDAEIINDNAKFLKDIINQLPDDWELFYMGYRGFADLNFKRKIKLFFIYKILNLLRIKKVNIKELAIRYTKKYSKNIRIAGIHDLTHAYAIRLPLAKKLIKLQTPICCTSDGILEEVCKEKGIKKYLCVPKIFKQSESLKSAIW